MTPPKTKIYKFKFSRHSFNGTAIIHVIKDEEVIGSFRLGSRLEQEIFEREHGKIIDGDRIESSVYNDSGDNETS